MKKYTFGEYIIGAEPERTRAYYASKGPYFLRCACPGCQNFFKSMEDCAGELSEYLEFFGADWKKPESIEVLCVRDERLVYSVEYKIFGRRLKAPKQYSVEKNSLGSIRVRKPESLYKINDKMSLAFEKSGKDGVVLRLTAELPWVMETMNCIYDSGVERVDKPRVWRIERIARAAKRVMEEINR